MSTNNQQSTKSDHKEEASPADTTTKQQQPRPSIKSPGSHWKVQQNSFMSSTRSNPILPAARDTAASASSKPTAVTSSSRHSSVPLPQDELAATTQRITKQLRVSAGGNNDSARPDVPAADDDDNSSDEADDGDSLLGDRRPTKRQQSVPEGPATPTTPYRSAATDTNEGNTKRAVLTHSSDVESSKPLHRRTVSDHYDSYQTEHTDEPDGDDDDRFSSPYMHTYDGVDQGSLSDSSSHRQVRERFPGKKLRRNITAVNRKLQQFKRVKKHKVHSKSGSAHDLKLYGDVTAQADIYRLSSYCVCDTYELSAIIQYLEQDRTLDAALTLYADVLQVKFHYNSNKQQHRDTFIFTYGALVFWNHDEKEEQQFIQRLSQFAVSSIPKDEWECEEFDYSYGHKSAVANDEVTLTTTSSLEKLSISFALAQCCKLSVYEERISREVDRNASLPEELATTGKISLSRHEISRKIGSLFIERNNVNLHFDLLDSPEFFWEQDKFKPLYDRLFGYLELQKRVDLLNKRLDILKELFDMLNDHAENAHSHFLEWIIIWLIVVETVLAIYGAVNIGSVKQG